jgi:fructosamine-3-kinase
LYPLDAAGLAARELTLVAGGMAAVTGRATLLDGRDVIAKTFREPPAPDVFAIEVRGLAAIAVHGPVTPAVVHVDVDLLVLQRLHPAPATREFWIALARDVARMHSATRTDRFGWDHDTWLGSKRQDNTPTDDGYEFFAQRRLLRWLPEPRVRAKLDADDVAALHRLCARLPELLPPAPACLVHGDFWAANVLACPDGRPAVIDPAVSSTWAEIDLAHLWSTPRPAEADAFFPAYTEAAGTRPGWQERMPYLQLRQDLALVAMFDDDWGACETVRRVLRPFRPRRNPTPESQRP